MKNKLYYKVGLIFIVISILLILVFDGDGADATLFVSFIFFVAGFVKYTILKIEE